MTVSPRFLPASLTSALVLPHLLMLLVWVRWSDLLANAILVLTSAACLFGIVILILAFRANAKSRPIFPARTIKLAVAVTFAPLWLLTILFLIGFGKSLDALRNLSF